MTVRAVPSVVVARARRSRARAVWSVLCGRCGEVFGQRVSASRSRLMPSGCSASRTSRSRWRGLSRPVTSMSAPSVLIHVSRSGPNRRSRSGASAAGWSSAAGGSSGALSSGCRRAAAGVSSPRAGSRPRGDRGGSGDRAWWLAVRVAAGGCDSRRIPPGPFRFRTLGAFARCGVVQQAKQVSGVGGGQRRQPGAAQGLGGAWVGGGHRPVGVDVDAAAGAPLAEQDGGDAEVGTVVQHGLQPRGLLGRPGDEREWAGAAARVARRTLVAGEAAARRTSSVSSSSSAASRVSGTRSQSGAASVASPNRARWSVWGMSTRPGRAWVAADGSVSRSSRSARAAPAAPGPTRPSPCSAARSTTATAVACGPLGSRTGGFSVVAGVVWSVSCRWARCRLRTIGATGRSSRRPLPGWYQRRRRRASSSAALTAAASPLVTSTPSPRSIPPGPLARLVAGAAGAALAGAGVDGLRGTGAELTGSEAGGPAGVADGRVGTAGALPGGAGAGERDGCLAAGGAIGGAGRARIQPGWMRFGSRSAPSSGCGRPALSR